MLDLSKEIILEAQSNTKSNSEAARWLGINYLTYRKCAKMYDLFDGHLNQKGVGISKGGWNIKTHKTIKKQVKSVRQKLHICRECGDTDLNNFYKLESTYKDKVYINYKLDCKPCLNKKRAHRWATDEEFRKKQRKRRNTESYKMVARKRHFDNRDKILKQQKDWYYNNGGKEQAKEYKKEYHKLPYVKAAKLQREIVYRVLYQIGTKKEKHSHEYLNYTAEDLRLHIESLFKSGMNWNNNGWGKGKWQLDHKKEVAQFIQEGIEDPNIINALSNLQPLWTEEHARKTGKFMRSFSKKF